MVFVEGHAVSESRAFPVSLGSVTGPQEDTTPPTSRPNARIADFFIIMETSLFILTNRVRSRRSRRPSPRPSSPRRGRHR